MIVMYTLLVRIHLAPLNAHAIQVLLEMASIAKVGEMFYIFASLIF